MDKNQLDHITMENIDSLTEEELRVLEKRYKDSTISPTRLWLLIPFNLLSGGLTMYYTLNFKHFSKKFFTPKKFGLGEIIKYGTIQSLSFLALYIGGTCFITGMWHPVQYLRGLALIKGKQIDTAVKFDPYVQQHFLYNAMSYFGLSDELIKNAKTELDNQKQDLENRNFFADDTLKLLNQPVDLDQKQEKQEK